MIILSVRSKYKLCCPIENSMEELYVKFNLLTPHVFNLIYNDEHCNLMTR